VTTATKTESVIILGKIDRGAMTSGGTASFTVEVDGKGIGRVGDDRTWTGSRFAGRR
jgi:hypothetical protein